jgi:hypothetical protein
MPFKSSAGFQCSPGGRERSTAARLATSGETLERGKAVDTYAQAVVQRSEEPCDRLMSQTDESKPAAKRFGSCRDADSH